MLRSFIGQGYYGTHTPGVILRNILENPAWYTAYTPYQAEISQGRMEALVNFQTMVCDLTGMPIANASMLDEATAAAEAMTLARRSVKAKGSAIVVSGDAHPQTIEVMQTRAAPLGLSVKLANSAAEWDAAIAADDYFAALIQYPCSSGWLMDWSAEVDKIHARGAAAIFAADLLALALLKTPGEMGADIVVGTTQRFGMPMGAGGPHAAYMACRDEFKRSLPGRLVGVSVDVHGQSAYRLALQTREQHIRREKATSNICTAQVLPAVIASMYAVYHGPEGLARIARRVARFTAILSRGLAQLGYAAQHHTTAFDTLCLKTNGATDAIAARAVAKGANLRKAWGDYLCISLDETTTRADIELLWSIFAKDGQPLPGIEALDDGNDLIPAELRRTSSFLTHPVFNTHHSETGMLRYIRALSDKDLALDRSMIPLGSCTMKLNATSEMIPITWPEFAQVHPFAPADQLAGYRQLDEQLRAWLCQATGYAGVSLQPNAGSQGEYAGLLAIKAYHAAQGQGHRTVCLIPSSAHGTNPASAQMVGMQVVVTKCDENGNVDMADLQAKCAQHSQNLACVMITYPSTHGVFETQVKELCQIVHQHGGRVYVDGANMNALVGVAAPGEFGGDVSHLNLHKTFCIPHGGGGPGVGPVCVVEDLGPGGRHRRRGRGIGRAAGQRRRAADLVDVHPHDGRRGPDGRHRGRHPQRQLHQRAPQGPLPHALRIGQRPRGARVHPGPAPAQGNQRRDGRGRSQAPDRLRLPRAHAELPRGQYAHGGAHRERNPGRDRPLHRRDDRHPRGDPPSRERHLAAGRQPFEERAAHRPQPARGRLGPPLHARGRRLPRGQPARGEVLEPRGPRGQRVRRPEPVLQLRAGQRIGVKRTKPAPS